MDMVCTVLCTRRWPRLIYRAVSGLGLGSNKYRWLHYHTILKHTKINARDTTRWEAVTWDILSLVAVTRDIGNYDLRYGQNRAYYLGYYPSRIFKDQTWQS